MLLKYPQNSNLTIMNTIYHRPVKNPETGKYKKDFFLIHISSPITKPTPHSA